MHAEPNTIPDEEESAVTPGDDSNTDPAPPLPADPAAPTRNPAVDTAATMPGQPGKEEEPEMGNERDIPSDGRDLEGEGIIRQLNVPAPPGQAEKP